MIVCLKPSEESSKNNRSVTLPLIQYITKVIVQLPLCTRTRKSSHTIVGIFFNGTVAKYAFVPKSKNGIEQQSFNKLIQHSETGLHRAQLFLPCFFRVIFLQSYFRRSFLLNHICQQLPSNEYFLIVVHQYPGDGQYHQ